MIETGHLLIDSEGAVVSMDAAFCDIMDMDEQALRGRAILDVTAPADRQECGQALARLQSTGRPFCVTKRFLRDDGTLVWVKNTVSLIAGGTGSGTIMATVEPVVLPQEHSPATLLDAARAHIVTRHERATVGDAKLFSEPGWDTVLAVYVAEAEGRAIDAKALAALLDNSQAMTERWLKALLQHNIVELEYRRPDPLSAKSYRLTAATHRKLEAFLGRHLVRYRVRMGKAA